MDLQGPDVTRGGETRRPPRRPAVRALVYDAAFRAGVESLRRPRVHGETEGPPPPQRTAVDRPPARAAVGALEDPPLLRIDVLDRGVEPALGGRIEQDQRRAVRCRQSLSETRPGAPAVHRAVEPGFRRRENPASQPGMRGDRISRGAPRVPPGLATVQALVDSPALGHIDRLRPDRIERNVERLRNLIEPRRRPGPGGASIEALVDPARHGGIHHLGVARLERHVVHRPAVRTENLPGAVHGQQGRSGNEESQTDEKQEGAHRVSPWSQLLKAYTDRAARFVYPPRVLA